MIADRLAELGYPVFPVVQKGKRPLTRNGCKDCTTDFNLIADWANQYPDCNWGITCVDLFVLDIDGDQGRASFARLEEELGSLPDAPCVTTGRGFHLYFKRPEGEWKASVDKALSIDIRTGYTYVIAPGSVHPSGAVYAEKIPLCPVEELPEFPAVWLDRLQKKTSPPPKPAAPPAIRVSGAPSLTQEDYSDLEKYVAEIDTRTEGDGGNAMMRVCNAIYWEWGADRSDTRARAILDGYNRRVCRHDGTPYPWSEDEIQHKIESVFTRNPIKPFGSRRRAALNAEALNFSLDFTVNQAQRAAVPEGGATSDSGLLLESWETVICKPLKWIWQNRITLGELTLICGAGGIGKSALVQDWMARVTAGRDWPDGCSCQQGRVLYFTSEESTQRKVIPHFKEWGGDVRYVESIVGTKIAKNRTGYFTLADCNELEKYAKKHFDTPHPLRMLVLDPITGAMGDTDANSMTKVRAIIQPLTDLAEKYQFAVIALCHPNKNAGNPKNGRVPVVDLIAGSQAFGNTSRAAWWCWKAPSGTIKCFNCKTNAEVPLKGFYFKFTESRTRRITNCDNSSYDFCFGDPLYINLDVENTADDEYYADMEDARDEHADDRKQRRGKRDGQTKKDAAKDWLESYLLDGPRPVDWAKKIPDGIRTAGEALGYSYPDLTEAKRELKLQELKIGGQKCWALPQDTLVVPKVREPDEQDKLETLD